MAGLNLLAAIVIYWNTKHLGQPSPVAGAKAWTAYPTSSPISPLGWAHILLTGNTGGRKGLA